MKILIISFTFPPQVGGVSEVALTQALGFAARGHEVSVATEYDAARQSGPAEGGINIRQFKIGGTLGGATRYMGEEEAYRKFITTEPADVMLLHCWQNRATDEAIPALPQSRAKKVFLSHGFDAHVWKPHPRFSWGLGSWLRAQPYVWRLPRMMKAFDRLVFLSARCDAGRFFDHWVAERLLPSRVSIIPNGVHLSSFRQTPADFRKAYGIETKYMVLNVANYCDRKNQLATLRDFMSANRPDATLVFIGGEFNDYQKEMARVQEERRALFPQARIVFLEKAPREMIYAAYQAADVFMLSAKQETQPLAILDAMAAGRPFLSTNAGCVSEFPGGLVMPSGPAMTRAIQRLLDDTALRRQLGAQGRAACETKYDWERVLDAYEDLFVHLTSRAHK